MKLPKISIITPSYNQGKFIRATIDSVLSQGYPNLEYFVIDGGSTDDTVAILKSYGKQIRWVSEGDRGQTHAINKGLKMASGELLAYLNSDDVYYPGALKRVGEYYQKTKVDWITGDCIVIDEAGLPTRGGWLIRGYKRLLLKLYSRTTLKIVDNMIPQPSTFWSRQAYLTTGEFRENYHYVMDYDYWLRLSGKYRPHDLGVVLAGFRAQPNSKSETSRDLLMAEGDLALKNNGANSLHLALHRLHSSIVRFIYNLLKN